CLDQVDPAPVHSFGLRPRRHRNQKLLPPSPVSVRPFPMLPASRAKVLAAAERPEIAARRVANQHHIPAVPPIPTVRTTARHISLAPKRDASVPPGTALNPNLRLVVHGTGESSGALFGI